MNLIKIGGTYLNLDAVRSIDLIRNETIVRVNYLSGSSDSEDYEGDEGEGLKLYLNNMYMPDALKELAKHREIEALVAKGYKMGDAADWVRYDNLRKLYGNIDQMIAKRESEIPF